MTSDMRTRAADLIDAAIDVLNRRGWVRGRYEAADGVCMSQAVYIAGAVDAQAYRPAYRSLRCSLGMSITAFNDNVAESVEDVLLAMKQAAASLREPQP